MKRLQIQIKDESFTVWYLSGPKNAPVLHWAHGNGFNAQTYTNLITKLSEYCHVYAWDARAHGLSSKLKLPARNHIYETYADDFTRLIEQLYKKHSSPIIIAGHSFGATLCIKAELALRGKISKMILADPVLYTPLVAKGSQFLRLLKFKKPKSIYLAENANKRQNLWLSKTDALTKLSQKSLFKNWDTISLRNYIEYGTANSPGGVQLSCPPLVESLIFKESELEILTNEINSLAVDTHILLASSGSPTFAIRALEKSNRVKKLITLQSTNHLFPIEQDQRLLENIIPYIKK